jgi:hypothetical protein
VKPILDRLRDKQREYWLGCPNRANAPNVAIFGRDAWAELAHAVAHEAGAIPRPKHGLEVYGMKVLYDPSADRDDIRVGRVA